MLLLLRLAEHCLIAPLTEELWFDRKTFKVAEGSNRCWVRLTTALKLYRFTLFGHLDLTGGAQLSAMLFVFLQQTFAALDVMAVLTDVGSAIMLGVLRTDQSAEVGHIGVVLCLLGVD